MTSSTQAQRQPHVRVPRKDPRAKTTSAVAAVSR